MIRRLEELSANAWPGLRADLVDGWIVRFAEGYSNRANCVLPLYPGTLPLDQKINHCVEVVRSRGGVPTFKIFTEVVPADLDTQLDRRGYQIQSRISVMTLDRLPAAKPALPEGFRITVSNELERSWFMFYASSLNERQSNAARAIMEHIVPVRRFVLLEGKDGPAACALAVVEDGWAGIFDVLVREDLRGQGLGRLIMELTLGEATAAGAQRSYLQVAQGNAPAEGLYGQLGYAVAYAYWYRVLPENG